MLESLFPLNIFPEGSLANSIIVTVWIGILVIAFFNLRFGWVLSGLVVPGYLVPLLLIKPVSVGVIIFEAWVTYVISLLICNKTGSWLKLSHFFGRDRFFLLVMISVFVRLFFDAFTFPLLSDYLKNYWDIELIFQNDLHSFGLIIISLIANQMWKTGLIRGSWHLFVTVGLTFLIVKYILISGTNFSIANLSFMYEEISVAILASPKSYIIVLLCCYLASRMNLLYGWEFSGILIPSLLALQWYFPQKILVTFIETFIILGLGSLAIRIPKIAAMDIAGGRKLVLFFTIGFLYKFILAYIIEWYSPYSKVSDYFAFGYLLSTLLAIKIHDKNLLIHTTRATLQTSLTAVLIATFIGFGLSKVDLTSLVATELDVNSEQLETTDASFDDWFLNKKVEFFETKSQDYILQPSISDIDNFTQVLQLLDQKTLSSEDLTPKVQALLSTIGYKIIEQKDHVILYPLKNKAWGVYAINKDPNAYPILVSTPRGLDEDLAYDATFSLYKLLNAKYLAISTSPFKSNTDGSSDYLLNPNTLFSYFQKILSNSNVMQLRTTKRDVELVAKRYSHLVTSDEKSYLWIQGRLRKGFDLKSLSEFTQEPEIIWSAPDFYNSQRDAGSNGFLELLINKNIANRLKVLASTSQQNIQQLATDISIEGYLNELILNEKSSLAPKLSNLYVEPKNYESLFFHEELVTPLLELVDEFSRTKKWTDETNDLLQNINQTSHLFNYQLTQYTYIRNKKEYLILSEIPNAQRRYWGTYIFALGETSDQIVEIPRPLMELGTFEYGLFLFNHLNAKALLIAGSHPNANVNGKSDVINRYNKDSVFNIVHYSIFNHFKNDFLQANLIRSMGFDEAVNNPGIDLIVSEDSNLDSQRNAYDKLLNITSLLNSLNLRYQKNTDNVTQSSIGNSYNSLVNQLRYQRNKQIVTQWISPLLIDSLKQNEEQWLNNKHFLAVGLQSEYKDIVDFMNEQQYSSLNFSNEYQENIDKFVQSDNIVYLLDTILHSGYDYKLIIDIDSKQTFLMFLRSGKIQAIRNLNGLNQSVKYIDSDIESSIQSFLNNRHNWLFAKAKP